MKAWLFLFKTHTIMASMNDRPQAPATWVDQQSRLDEILPSLSASHQIAVDTESNSLYAYQEQVCLIQLSSQGQDYLIDGLAKLDLTAIGELFSNPVFEKIFHAAEYDILCLKRDFGFSFINLFDTMQAARILGYEKLGLANMLEDLLGIAQVKCFQKADWGKRPLSAGMLDYARMDTQYLAQLRDLLESQLRQKGLLELAREDFERLCRVESNHKNTTLYAQVSGYQHLDGQGLRILEELCQYRDQQARKLNRPHFKVIGNAALLAVAQARPVRLTELNAIKELSPKLVERHGKGLLDAARQGTGKTPIQHKNHKRPAQAFLDRLESLKEWRKKAAAAMRVQSDIILPRDILEEIAGKNPPDEQALQDVMNEVPWRFSHFGQEILAQIKQENHP